MKIFLRGRPSALDLCTPVSRHCLEARQIIEDPPFSRSERLFCRISEIKFLDICFGTNSRLVPKLGKALL